MPVFLPHDSEYISLFIGAISLLANHEYYDETLDPDLAFDVVSDNFQQTTIAPLIAALANSSDLCTGGSMALSKIEAIRTTTQSLTTSTGWKAVSFDSGSAYDSVNPSRVTPVIGVGIVSASVHLDLGSNGLCECGIMKNGTNLLAYIESRTSNTNHAFSISAIDEFDGSDYIELVLRSNQNANLAVSDINPVLRVAY